MPALWWGVIIVPSLQVHEVMRQQKPPIAKGNRSGSGGQLAQHSLQFWVKINRILAK